MPNDAPVGRGPVGRGPVAPSPDTSSRTSISDLHFGMQHMVIQPRDKNFNASDLEKFSPVYLEHVKHVHQVDGHELKEIERQLANVKSGVKENTKKSISNAIEKKFETGTSPLLIAVKEELTELFKDKIFLKTLSKNNKGSAHKWREIMVESAVRRRRPEIIKESMSSLIKSFPEEEHSRLMEEVTKLCNGEFTSNEHVNHTDSLSEHITDIHHLFQQLFARNSSQTNEESDKKGEQQVQNILASITNEITAKVEVQDGDERVQEIWAQHLQNAIDAKKNGVTGLNNLIKSSYEAIKEKEAQNKALVDALVKPALVEPTSSKKTKEKRRRLSDNSLAMDTLLSLSVEEEDELMLDEELMLKVATGPYTHRWFEVDHVKKMDYNLRGSGPHEVTIDVEVLSE